MNQQLTTAELQAPSFVQTYTEWGGVKHNLKSSSLCLTLDNGDTAQHNNNLSKADEKVL